MEKDPSRSTSPGGELIRLREFEKSLQEVKDLIQSKVENEKALREAKEASVEKANRLALTEIERRLSELNHAHAQAMENWARTLPREMFASFQKDHDEWKRKVENMMTSTADHPGDIKGLQGRMAKIDGTLQLLEGMQSKVTTIEKQVEAFEKLANRITGMGILLGVMGLVGVIAFFLSIARLAGVIK